jgi:hypothetical protein
MAGHGGKLGRKREEAITALLTHRSVEDAARAAGIATVTLWRWLRLPEFQAAYRQARREAFSQSIARLQQASAVAVSTLLKVMLDANAPAAVRVRAASSVLDHAATAIEIDDMEGRLAALERATEISPSGQNACSSLGGQASIR